MLRKVEFISGIIHAENPDDAERQFRNMMDNNKAISTHEDEDIKVVCISHT